MVKLSCIILSAANTDFVKNRMIPSIRENTNCPYEIIIVYNGKEKAPKIDNVKVISSDFSWISRGYNKGVKAAKGEYLAIFHDDCVINDKSWFEICLKNLDNDVVAVSPETSIDAPFHLERMKCVPLVMRKDTYQKLGGFDEHYFAGKEELDFTYNLLSKGCRYKKVNFKYEHYRAISTILLLSGKSRLPEEIKTKKQIKELTNCYLDKFLALGFNLVIHEHEIYFFNKYIDFFKKIGMDIKMINQYTTILKNKIEFSQEKEVYDHYKNNKKEFIKLYKNLKIS